jgi:hypothetical protein
MSTGNGLVATSVFPTFCHIGEYDEYGYQMLHRMLAMSQPLNLWAPTSPQLAREGCRIPPRAFLDYVQEGRIRVLAREEWLTSRTFRDNLAFKAERPYPEARWTESFDGELKKMCEADASLPGDERKVVAAPKEGGWQWAEQYLAERPDQVARWNRIARSEVARWNRAAHTDKEAKIPAGTLQAALRHAKGNPDELAAAILRDAYNHGQAVRLSGADVPFLLTAADRQFLDILREAADPDRPTARGTRSNAAQARKTVLPTEPPPIDETSVELAAQLLDLLRLFDIASPRSRRDAGLDKFISGEGHHQLAAWLNRMCDQFKQSDARNLDHAVVTALQADLRRGELSSPLYDMVRHPVATSVGAIGLATAVVGFMIAPGDPLATAGFFASAFPVAGGLLQALGYVPTSFTGPQWPFLYTYASSARKQQIAHLLDVLDEA